MKAEDLPPVAIVGSGPAALMAAHVVASAGVPVRIFEKKKGPGRKLLIAGSSGLNITYDAPLEEFLGFYSGPRDCLEPILRTFPPEAWRNFIEDLGIKTFLGTSHRWFIENMKASILLRAWLQALQKLGAEIAFEHECTEFERLGDSEIRLSFAGKPDVLCRAVCFALGGASYEPNETPLRWPKIFTAHGLKFEPFEASNVGFKIRWSEKFLKEAEGKALKNVVLTTARGSKRGDTMITRYGIEGTPVYFVGIEGSAHLDLKPDLTAEQIQKKLSAAKENLSPLRRAKKYLKLDEVRLALLFHYAPAAALESIEALSATLKKFPLQLGARQPIAEALSSSGGLSWNELDGRLMIKRFPGVFAAGEMLDWDAPTGGFLIQACVSQGFVAGKGLVSYLLKTNA